MAQAGRARPLGVALAILLGAAGAGAAAAHAPAARSWTAAWATAQHVAGPALQDQTVRTITRLTQGGTGVRLRLGHAVGTAPLQVGRVTVAVRQEGAAVHPASLRPVTFGGAAGTTVPAGGYVVSDPVDLATAPQQDLAVSVHLPGAATPSAHREAFETSYLTAAGAGDRTGDTSGASFTGTTTQFLVVTAVDVDAPRLAGAVVVVGGSVTDGAGSRKTGPLGTGPAAPEHSRWSDVLARRVLTELGSGEQLSVVQAGIGGDAAADACRSALPGAGFGSVQSRYQRDVLSLSGVRHVVVYAGTNDLGNGCSAKEVMAAFRDLIARAHEQGVRVVVATVTPRVTYSPAANAERSVLNRWIRAGARCSGECDGVVDFDGAVAWPAYPNAIDPAFDSGDTIHPNAEGYAEMGRSIDLGYFRRR